MLKVHRPFVCCMFCECDLVSSIAELDDVKLIFNNMIRGFAVTVLGSLWIRELNERDKRGTMW